MRLGGTFFFRGGRNSRTDDMLRRGCGEALA